MTWCGNICVAIVWTENYKAVLKCYSGLYMYLNRKYESMICTYHSNIKYLTMTQQACRLLLLLSGDIHPNPGPVSLSLCHSNIRGLIVKTDQNPKYKAEELYSTLCLDGKFDFICISETHLDGSISDEYLPFPEDEYLIHRRDRVDGTKGGVCILGSSSIAHVELKELRHPHLENIWIEAKINNKSFMIGVFYRPPDSTVQNVDNFIDYLQDNLTEVYKRSPESIFLLGDFNDRCQVWESDHKDSDLKLKLYNLIQNNDLSQLIDEPTRITVHSANILDLLITDLPGYVMNSGVFAPIANTDHCTIFCRTSVQYIKDKPYTRSVFNYKNANFDSLNEDLTDTPFVTLFNAVDNVDDATSIWYSLLNENIKEHIPSYLVTIRPKDKPWMTSEAKKLLRIRDRNHKRFKRTNSLQHEQLWKKSRADAKIAICHAKSKYFDKLYAKLEDPNTAPKQYWKISKSFYGCKRSNSIPSIVHNGAQYNTASDKAEVFNNYFASQQQLCFPNHHELPPLIIETVNNLDKITVSEHEVKKILQQLDTNKATGPDNVGNLLLKKCASSLNKSLTSLFNKSFDLGQVPQLWKTANVSPVFKKNDKSSIKNYRPVSLLPCVAKVQERLVYNVLYDHCIRNNLLTWRNSGFKKLDSAMYQVINISHTIFKELELGKDACLVFLDVSKAFDKVWHGGLLHKLRCKGVSGQLLDWFDSYLKGRKQRVVINGQQSSLLEVSAGVPQGSILGPLLFLIYINDIVTNVSSDIFMFADDTILFEIIENHERSFTTLNNDLDVLSRWAAQWLVTFNAGKTEYMVISRKKHTYCSCSFDIK